MKQFFSKIILIATGLFLYPILTFAQANNIIISEIQTYGQTSKDEFIRLYNPTQSAIDISSWKLTKKTSSGSESNLVSSFEDNTEIPAQSYFLITHKTDYQGTENANATYSGASYSIANNNTVILKNSEDMTIDKVGFGEATDFEGAPAQNPENGTSIKRRDNQDTNNNADDFLAENITPPTGGSPSKEEQSKTDAPPETPYGTILINEVMPNPQEGKEWIELYNSGSQNADITGWQIKDGSEKIYTLQGTIYADSFYIAEIKSRLNNSGDAIYLSDQNNNSQHQLIYGNWRGAEISAPKKGESIALQKDGSYIISQTPTKNFTNIESQEHENTRAQEHESIKTQKQPSPTSTSYKTSISDIENNITITEILPNPKGSDTNEEWIELYNNSDNDIDLGELYLDDQEGGSKPYKIPQATIIKARGYLLFPRTETNLALNNTGDCVRLLDSNKEEIINIEYDGAKENLSYAYSEDDWQWTASLTPLAENKIAISLASGSSSSQNNSSKSATGIVIAPPNLFSTQTIYIDGLQLYMYSKDWPELEIGDKINVWGEPSTYFNEPRLKLKNRYSIKIISKNNPIEPVILEGDSISDEFIGKLITAEAEILEISGTKIFIDIAGAEIFIYNKLKLPLPEINESDLIKITGILSKYKDNYRILLRNTEDLQILKQAKVEKSEIDKSMPLWQYLLSTLTFGAFCAGAIYLRRRKDNEPKNKATQTLE